LQVPLWKSGVTSHSRNWQIWCSPWGDDALQYLMQLMATPDTDCYFWPPLCSGTHYPFMLVTCLWNLFSLCLRSWILLCSYKYLHVKFAVNKRSWQREDVNFFAEITYE
jgi:hypothetical protein